MKAFLNECLLLLCCSIDYFHFGFGAFGGYALQLKVRLQKNSNQRKQTETAFDFHWLGLFLLACHFSYPFFFGLFPTFWQLTAPPFYCFFAAACATCLFTFFPLLHPHFENHSKKLAYLCSVFSNPSGRNAVVGFFGRFRTISNDVLLAQSGYYRRAYGLVGRSSVFPGGMVSAFRSYHLEHFRHFTPFQLFCDRLALDAISIQSFFEWAGQHFCRQFSVHLDSGFHRSFCVCHARFFIETIAIRRVGKEEIAPWKKETIIKQLPELGRLCSLFVI